MHERKNKTLIVFITIIMSISVYLNSGCSHFETGDPNKVVIQKELEVQFTGPD